ncbi:edin [Drosophila busckii]|uniref:Edin n=1 Tax=Drosophila busckii TaxID=30019 RepID=A0A0M5J7V6_DROBS|nr:uncharacterized protein LOC108601027 [Drosophila busckii]ALC43098.1 edin [Drosophila busckii]
MSAIKFNLVLVLGCCLLALVAAQAALEQESLPLPLLRQRREGGSVVITASKDRETGRNAGVQYNHNLYTSGDGRGSIDAYANANRNFDHNRNDYGGGIQGRWRF